MSPHPFTHYDGVASGRSDTYLEQKPKLAYRIASICNAQPMATAALSYSFPVPRSP
jgi:hypothetical protein